MKPRSRAALSLAFLGLFLLAGAAHAESGGLKASPAAGFAPLTVTFHAFEEKGRDIPVYWDFGDGSPPQVLRARTVAHTFTRPGRYTVQAVNDITRFFSFFLPLEKQEATVLVLSPPPEAPATGPPPLPPEAYARILKEEACHTGPEALRLFGFDRQPALWSFESGSWLGERVDLGPFACEPENAPSRGQGFFCDSSQFLISQVKLLRALAEEAPRLYAKVPAEVKEKLESEDARLESLYRFFLRQRLVEVAPGEKALFFEDEDGVQAYPSSCQEENPFFWNALAGQAREGEVSPALLAQAEAEIDRCYAAALSAQHILVETGDGRVQGLAAYLAASGRPPMERVFVGAANIEGVRPPRAVPWPFAEGTVTARFVSQAPHTLYLKAPFLEDFAQAFDAFFARELESGALSLKTSDWVFGAPVSEPGAYNVLLLGGFDSLQNPSRLGDVQYVLWQKAGLEELQQAAGARYTGNPFFWRPADYLALAAGQAGALSEEESRALASPRILKADRENGVLLFRPSAPVLLALSVQAGEKSLYYGVLQNEELAEDAFYGESEPFLAWLDKEGVRHTSRLPAFFSVKGFSGACEGWNDARTTARLDLEGRDAGTLYAVAFPLQGEALALALLCTQAPASLAAYPYQGTPSQSAPTRPNAWMGGQGGSAVPLETSFRPVLAAYLDAVRAGHVCIEAGEEGMQWRWRPVKTMFPQARLPETVRLASLLKPARAFVVLVPDTVAGGEPAKLEVFCRENRAFFEAVETARLSGFYRYVFEIEEDALDALLQGGCRLREA